MFVKNNINFIKNLQIYNFFFNIPIQNNLNKYYYIYIYNFLIKYTKGKINILIKNKKNKFFKQFSLFNYYYINFYKKNFLQNITKLQIYPKYRNLYIYIYNKKFIKFWSIGIFIGLLKLKYRLQSVLFFIKTFFKKVQFYFNKNIYLFTNQFSSRYIIFFNQIRGTVKYLNEKIYKLLYIRIMHFEFKLKCINFNKRLKVKPRKKKYIRKKFKKYKY